MHTATLSHSFFFLHLPTALILISCHLPKSLSGNSTSSNCTRTFACGSIPAITYPFSTLDQPEHCGPPAFRLSCWDDFPELTIMSVRYRVLRLDQTQKTLTMARLDLWNNTCPKEYTNSTLNFTFFNYGGDNENLTLFYNCSPTDERLYNQFSCNTNSNSSYSYSLVGPVPTDPIFNDVVNCSVSLTVPILRSTVGKLGHNRTVLRDVLMEGFNVNYTDPYESRCLECYGAGRQCGFDSKLGDFACFCGDRHCPISGKKSTKWPLVIGAAVGAAAFILCVAFFVIWRRKQLAAQSKSKDLSTTPPSSNDFPRRPAHNFLQTLGSYPYTTKSDLENGSTYFGVQVFTYAELEEATDNFDSSNELGDGGFGTVYYGKLNDGREVAVKRLYERNFKRVEQFVNEVEILAHLRHQNLVTLYGCTSRRSRELLLVYEYISNGTVADHLHGNRAESGFLRWPARLSIAVETADALAYLHATDIIHRDVKTNNILLDNSFRVKVADFGLSRLFPNDMTHVSTAPQGTPGYVDPEYYHCYQLTNKSDVYSFGVVLVELISSKQAVDTNRHRQEINLANMAISKIQNSSLHELVDPCLGFETDYGVRRTVTLVAELAFRCLQQDRDLRPSMVEVVEVLRGIESHELSTRKGEVVDIGGDDVGLLRGNNILSFSPDSVVNAKWVSSSTTPNSC
ncbi:LEAF RUST 10 DISEASE-RESISTANCE LOCUS RECEPTOR-LIKE PROTEIN KINASE-like 1.4 isoform X3 [Malania oleifera]|uniref:LEAF RUST 10 DISEASE-RESISTANCE LOCUS RECEPTOR-LIKE PROTEIN KINASE-like 1.4 isoform X3 n=1 Tax=Malania oleifera TaxID=397392 RepID=UPI0025AECCF8|nr:LEAF RUST 10 DISEASE-RESISTANCE LOCUS RECEPTOR-LIKE PROTEIN KINASE-like 1.4 isoform X3 [Malania oleifera]